MKFFHKNKRIKSLTNKCNINIRFNYSLIMSIIQSMQRFLFLKHIFIVSSCIVGQYFYFFIDLASLPPSLPPSLSLSLYIYILNIYILYILYIYYIYFYLYLYLSIYIYLSIYLSIYIKSFTLESQKLKCM